MQQQAQTFLPPMGRTATRTAAPYREKEEAKQGTKAGPLIKAAAGSIGGIAEAHALQPMVCSPS